MKKLFAARLMLDVAGRLIMMGVVIFLSRSLGVATFGQLAYGLSIVNISYFLCDFGVATFFLREMGRATDADRPVVWEKFFGLKVVMATVVLVLGSLLSFKLWRWAHPEILVLLYISMIGNSFLDFFNYACNALQNLKASAVMLLVHKGLTAAAVFAVCLSLPTLPRASLAMAAGGLLGVILSLIVIKRSLRLPIKVEWKPTEWAHWLKETAPLALANVVIIAYGRFGILFLPSLRGDTETGLYAAAHKLFEAGYIIPAALMGVLMPRLSKSHSLSAEAFSADLKKTFKSTLLLVLAWVAASEPCSVLLIRILFGEQYLGAVPVLRILLLVNGLVIFNGLLSSLMIIYNKLTWHAINGVITALVAAILAYEGIRRYGGVGAAGALLLTEVVFTALTVFALMRLRYNEAHRARSSVG